MSSAAQVAVSISELARRIGSSRTHVIKLLNDAAAAGLVDRSSGNGVMLLPRLSEAVHEFFAIGYLFLTHCAKTIRERHETAVRPAPGRSA
jgi:DNA-binding GntR family transcriptional regulator